MSDIQRLNYSTHAIEDLGRLAQQWQREMPETARVIRRITEHLESAQKFLLPNRCELLDPETVREAHLDLLKLPYPITVLEVPYQFDDDQSAITRVGDLDVMPSTRRIALCFDETSWDLAPPALIGENELWQGIYVVPVFYQNETKAWGVCTGGAFVPSDYTMPDEETEASQRFRDDAIQAGLAGKNSLHFRSEPFVLCPELFQMYIETTGKDKATRAIINDTRDEIIFLIQMCSVINCENVKLDAIDPSVTLNKKRKRKGKTPLFRYHVLQIGKTGRETNDIGGTHASPRMHLRRGHIRRLQSGKTTWVRPSMVNPTSKEGVVMKDYRVSPDRD